MRNSLLLVYLLTTTACIGGCAWILHVGTGLQGRVAPSPQAVDTVGRSPILDNLDHPLSILLLQLIVVISAAKLLGRLFQYCHQPAVIGEMLAGILLGPSLLGAVLPASTSFLFPAKSLDTLHLLSQIGVIVFMFFVGIELDLSAMRQRARAAVLVSHVSIVGPFLLGCALALGVYSDFAPAGVAFTPFALFLGIAMSITAFPVLARIIKERGLERTPLGTIAIACAAVDDVTAWCMLAVIVAIGKASGMGGAALTILLALLFVGVMMLLVRPRVLTLTARGARSGAVQNAQIAAALVFAFLSALCTEVIGIHALFGAFLAGVLLPTDAAISKALHARVEAFASLFLLPLFFAFTGLRTEIGLLDTPGDWLVCAAIVAVAVAGKFGGTVMAARFAGFNWRDSSALGALMNTRGLMELIVLNIGYDMGILSPRIFAMMVVMALVTTLMTGPILSLLLRRRESSTAVVGEAHWQAVGKRPASAASDARADEASA